MESWWEILTVFLFSSVKFFFGGVPLALGYDFSHWESIIVTTLGGWTGVTVFVYASDGLLVIIKRRAERTREQNPHLAPKKKFTRTNRMIINIKRKTGLWGFSMMVPFLIPVPVGCFLAVRYFRQKPKIMFALAFSVLFWAVAGAFLYKPLFDAIRYYIL